MSVPLIAGGALALVATAIHGVGGELWFVRKVSLDTLPSSRFGRPSMTKAMIHVAWHITTVAFFSVAVALLLAGTVLDGNAAEALSLLAAGTATGFAAVALGVRVVGSSLSS